MLRLGLILLLLSFAVVANAETYGDVIGQFYGQVCDTVTQKCESYSYEIQSGGVWSIFCVLYFANGSYAYPCYYDTWAIKGSTLLLRAFGRDMKCILYGENKGMVCIYDTKTVLTGTRFEESRR